MDERYKNYMKYVKIAEDAMQSDKSSPSVDNPTLDQVGPILENLKDQNYAKDFGNLMYIISFALLTAVVLQFIQLGVTVRMLVMLVPLFFFLFYRLVLKHKTRKITDYKSKLAIAETSNKEKAMLQIDYIKAGIDLNRARIANTKYLYILITPFLLFSIAELLRGAFDVKSALWLLAGGFVISFLTWHYYFQSELDTLDEYDEDLEDIKEQSH